MTTALFLGLALAMVVTPATAHASNFDPQPDPPGRIISVTQQPPIPILIQQPPIPLQPPIPVR
jgi:hypothetical protein